MANKREDMFFYSFGTGLFGLLLMIFGFGSSLKLFIFTGILLLCFSITTFAVSFR